LNDWAKNIERADKLVQLVAREKGMSHLVLDQSCRWSTAGLRPIGPQKPPSRLLKNASVSRFVPLQRANRTESKTERIQAKMSFSAAC